MTETDICNMALSRLGEARIVSLSDSTTAGRLAALHYAPTRDAVLRSHRWNFALRRATLSEMAAAPAFGWAHQFHLPADWLRVCELNASEEGLGREWKIEAGTLLTDAETAQIVYVARVTEAEQFDPLFAQALALKLAAACTGVLRGSNAAVGDLLGEYERITAPLARRIDGNESRGRAGKMKELRSDFVAARGGV